MGASSILGTVALVLVVGGLVALVDHWREARVNRRLRPSVGRRAAPAVPRTGRRSGDIRRVA